MFGRGGGVPRWGGLHATHYYHMHTSRGDVCLGFPNPNSRGHATKRGKEKQEKKSERRTAFRPERIWRCTWARVLLRMQDLHFATNSAGKHFATNNIYILPRLANLALKSTDALIKRIAYTKKKGGAVGTMSPTHYLSKPGGGGLGRVAYNDAPPPP